MTQQTNPQESNQEVAARQLRRGHLSFGRVTRAPDTTADGQHHVKVQESGAPHDQPLPVLTQAHGDYYIPPENTPVAVLARGKNQYSVIGAAVPQVNTPTISAGERIISHPLSNANVRFEKDGTVYISGDEQIVINNGTQGIITDVQAGSTNDAGGITSLDIIRDSSVLI